MVDAARVALVLVGLATAAAVVPSEPSWSDVVTRYAAVRDYTARYEKQERAIDHGTLQTIRLSFRKPLDVRLDWVDEKGNVDQTAVYRDGMNGGKLIARRSGILGSLVGTVRLDPHDKRALEDSTHPITEVGLGRIIDGVARDLRQGRAVVQTAVEDAVESRRAWRFQFDATTTGPLVGLEGARRAIVWVDDALALPVKLEILDASGAMIERHQFKNLRLNIGLSDDVFTL